MPRFSDAQAPEAAPAKDYLIPLALIAAGFGISASYGLIHNGVAGLAGIAIYTSVATVVRVGLGVIACLITARIMGAAFGYAGSALLKLAAIFLFPSAVELFLPSIAGWIVGLILYWGLIEWLFELDAMETIVFAVVIWLVNIAAIFLVAVVGFSLGP